MRTALALAVTALLSLPLAGPGNVTANGQGELVLLWSRPDGHNATAWSVRWSPDGSRISQTFFDNTTVIWNATSGTRVMKLGSHPNATAEPGTRCDGNQSCSIAEHLPTRVTAWSPDGRYLAIGGDDTVIWVYDATDWTLHQALTGHAGSVLTLDFSPDGRYLASGSGTDKVGMHNVPENLVRVWDFASGNPVANLTGHGDGVLEVKWSGDGSRLVSASDDKTLKMWNATTWSEAFSMGLPAGHTGGVLSVDWSPNGTRLVSGSRDYRLALWNATDGALIAKWSAPNCVRSVDWHPGGEVVVGAGVAEAMVTIRNATTGVVLQTLDDNKDSTGLPVGAIMAARWSPDGTRLAIASGKEQTIRVYEFGQPAVIQPGTPAWLPGIIVFLSVIVAATLVTYEIGRRRLRRTTRR